MSEEEKKKISKAQQKAVKKYINANYDRMEIFVPKGNRDLIKTAAAAAGQSANEYIKEAVRRRMESEGHPISMDASEDD